jgi:hypothetical protein
MPAMRGLKNRVVAGLLVALASQTAGAQEISQTRPVDEHACVDVEVNGQRTLAYDCLSQLMKPADAPAAPDMTVGDAQSKTSNKAGLYNLSALEHRMGSNFGISAQPFRPKLSYPSPLVPAAPPPGK